MGLFRSFLLTISLITIFISNGFSSVTDSLRMERKADGLYIIHRVDAGETLFSLSRRYSSDLAKIAEINQLEGYSIDLGQILEIPFEKKEELNVPITKTVHKVKAGETLYAISHIYGLNIYDVKKWNNLLSDNVKVGQELVVSGKKEAKNTIEETAEAENQKEVSLEGNALNNPALKHTVIKGDNLFSISKKYNISQNDLMKRNHLENSVLSIGQVLIISDVKQENPRTNKETKKDFVINSGKGDGVPIKSTIDTNKPVVVKDVPIDSTNIRTQTFTKTVGAAENQFEKVYEEGVAMEIANSPKSKKYLCLHRALPTGTIIQVKNLINSQSIFVRVIGELPDTGNNENVLLRLSSVAYRRLGAVDARFPVEISYIPE